MHVCVCMSLILYCSLSNQGMLSCFSRDSHVHVRSVQLFLLTILFSPKPPLYLYHYYLRCSTQHHNIPSILLDGLLGLCKLADVHHRLSRALTHDDAQIAQWLAFEQDRITACRAHVAEKEEHFLSLTNGHFPTELSDPSHRPSEGLEESMGKLQREMTMRSQRLLEAEDEEDKAREVSVSVFAIVVILLI